MLRVRASAAVAGHQSSSLQFGAGYYISRLVWRPEQPLDTFLVGSRVAVGRYSARKKRPLKIFTSRYFQAKTEREKLEKLAHKGTKPERKPGAGSVGTASDADPSSTTSTSGASAEKASSDKFRNYGVLAGVATLGAAAGWYLNSKDKKQEVRD
ncbi:hypothetical protein GQ457_12G027350 [Hibiscus cannabinus]